MQHKPINDSSVEEDVWGLNALENLGSVVNGVEIGAKAKKLEDDKRVLFLAISYDLGVC